MDVVIAIDADKAKYINKCLRDNAKYEIYKYYYFEMNSL